MRSQKTPKNIDISFRKVFGGDACPALMSRGEFSRKAFSCSADGSGDMKDGETVATYINNTYLGIVRLLTIPLIPENNEQEHNEKRQSKKPVEKTNCFNLRIGKQMFCSKPYSFFCFTSLVSGIYHHARALTVKEILFVDEGNLDNCLPGLALPVRVALKSRATTSDHIRSSMRKSVQRASGCQGR